MIEFFAAWLIFGVLAVVTGSPLALFFVGVVTGVFWAVYATTVK
ncbi:hypothetical protein [Methylomonas rapida]|uniref:NfeD family protein n=1 Tax=Methylomonas rapida TaxID=2963939 RepID=A0ABY7GLW6_9GAMM|nr:hypothetical protein [Methylomonas rapida]WAR45498.1 hypothetical protein NM686_003005 [Methylomonas rapida]